MLRDVYGPIGKRGVRGIAGIKDFTYSFKDVNIKDIEL